MLGIIRKKMMMLCVAIAAMSMVMVSCSDNDDNGTGTPETPEKEYSLPEYGSVNRTPATFAVPYYKASDLPDMREPVIWFSGIKDLEFRGYLFRIDDEEYFLGSWKKENASNF